MSQQPEGSEGATVQEKKARQLLKILFELEPELIALQVAESEAWEDQDEGVKNALLAQADKICLEGQPFGFTWEDVDLIRALASWIPHEFSSRERDFRGIADRIAALLPPIVSPP